MRKAFVIAALVAGVALLFGAAVQAQYEDENHSRLNLKLGMFRPMGSAERASTSSQWYTESLAYDCKIDEQGHPAGQLAISQTEPRGSSDASILTASVSKLWWKNLHGGKSLYFGVGVGGARLKLIGDKTTTVEGDFFVGYAISDAYYLELRYIALPSWTATRPYYGDIKTNFSGLGLALGARRLF